MVYRIRTRLQWASAHTLLAAPEMEGQEEQALAERHHVSLRAEASVIAVRLTKRLALRRFRGQSQVPPRSLQPPCRVEAWNGPSCPLQSHPSVDRPRWIMDTPNRFRC
jgi:hypothetical protein